MIISEQQAHLAARYVEPPSAPTRRAFPQVTPELMSRVIHVVEAMPDTRPDRVVDAKDRLLRGAPNSDEIAEKIIARAICDSLR